MTWNSLYGDLFNPLFRESVNVLIWAELQPFAAQRQYRISDRTFHISRSIPVKFSAGIIDDMLLSLCELVKSGARNAGVFCYGRK